MTSIEIPDINADIPGTVDIDFSNITVTVYPKVGQPKQILRKVQGRCRKGRLMAVMGPSGAGKTTMLDVLVGNIYSGYTVEGEVLINGIPRNVEKFKKLTCYVYQKDVLLASATVEEAIITSAFLRLPQKIGSEAKQDRVRKIISDLGLDECRNTLIGDESIGLKGISGGQMRRLSVGIELVTDPKVIFLDEPTSGLDSEVALTIMQALKVLSSQGRTVICTIHQPNSDIVDTFDDFMLLACGRVTYGGKWDNAITFFQEAGYACPTFKNPTDFFMTQVSVKDRAEEIADKYEQLLVASGDNGKYIGISDRNVGDFPVQPQDKNERPYWIYQMITLFNRNMRNWWRNPLMFWAEFTQYAFLSVFCGLMYLQISDDLVNGSADRFASLFFLLVLIVFTPPFTACATWEKERKLLARELSTNSYTLYAFYIAKLLALVPFELIFSLAFSLISYFMIGYQAEASKFFIFWVVFLMCLLIAESIGQLCAIITKEATYAMVLLTIILVVLLAFTGFLVRDTPVYFEWVQDISFLNYGSSALAQNEFYGLNLKVSQSQDTQQQLEQILGGQTLVPNGTRTVSGELVTETNEIVNSLSLGANIAVLIGITIGMRIINYLGLMFAVKFKLL